MTITSEQVKEFVTNHPKVVRSQTFEKFPGLRVLKFTREHFWAGEWDEVTEACRGTVVDDNWNPVVMPFRKMFNRLENGRDFLRDEQVLAVRKVNGFMAAVTYVPQLGEVLVSTTGSLDSPFTAYAREVLPKKVFEYVKYQGRALATVGADQITYLFEICHSADPHIVPEVYGAYLLDAEPVRWELEVKNQITHRMWLSRIALEMGVMIPDYYTGRYGDIVKDSDKCKHEGFVVYSLADPTQAPLKLKSPYYKITKFFGRANDHKLKDILDGKSEITNIDNDYHELVNHLIAHREKFCSLPEQGKIELIRNFLNG